MSHRTQITLTDGQYDRLLAESKRTGLGLAQLVRQAIVTTYGPDPNHVARALAESFGGWADRDFDGEEYVERMRRGMAQRLAHHDRP